MDYEKLGVFYLGKKFDAESGKITEELVLYDSKDLTTHAVCISMTGSGKTGLSICLLEEAAMDGIPAIVIDPKGDMSNLLLQFPSLTAGAFRPWINEDEAKKKGVTPDAFASEQADMWEKGLASWGQSGERIGRFGQAADFAIYTPGSTAGRPVSIVNSFKAPDPKIIREKDAFREMLVITVTSLLGLFGVKADPLKSREHILLSNIMEYFWQRKEDLDLTSLIRNVQSPPISQIGVLDLETFYPAQERFELVVMLNNLLAVPSFQVWLEGESLDVGRLLYDESGKPRISIFSISHLSDSERMFFVSLLLNQVLGWMRIQPGTSSLRALLYFDEIFGYMPPTANPPSKTALLTLLKQARASGLGMMLATQNPVDLDYKGLSNAGTWFIGRLQTRQDRERVLDGLIGAAEGKGPSRTEMEKKLAGLANRIFLLHNVHETEPVVFHTRWAMSYLAGPLTRPQLKALAETASGRQDSFSNTGAAAVAAGPEIRTGKSAWQKPVLEPGIMEFFMSAQSPRPEGGRLLYSPYLWGSAAVQYVSPAHGIDFEEKVNYWVPMTDTPGAVDWEQAESLRVDESRLSGNPEEKAGYGDLPAAARKAGQYAVWKSRFLEHLYRNCRLDLYRSAPLGEISKPGENERDFKIRIRGQAREKRDKAMEALKAKYAAKIEALESKIRKAEYKTEREVAQARRQQFDTALSVGTTILGAFLGRKKLSPSTFSRAGTAVRSAGRSAKEKTDVRQAKEELAVLQAELDDLNASFEKELEENRKALDVEFEELETLSIQPQKKNIFIDEVGLLWVPRWVIEGVPLQAT